MTRILKAFTTPYSQMTMIDGLIVLVVLYVALVGLMNFATWYCNWYREWKKERSGR